MTDQTGAAVSLRQGQRASVVLRAPNGILDATIIRNTGGGWQSVPTGAAGQPGIFLFNTDALGDFALVSSPASAFDPLPLAVVSLAVAALVVVVSRGGRTTNTASIRTGSLAAETETAGQAAAQSMTDLNAPPSSHSIRRPSMSNHSSVTSVFTAGTGRLVVVGIASLIAVGACVTPADRPSATPTGSPIRIGAVFPIDGNASGLAKQELTGVQIAADFVNADGGIGGRPIVLDVRDLESREDAPSVMAKLNADGVSAVVGAYSSDLSIAASAAADERAGSCTGRPAPSPTG